MTDFLIFDTIKQEKREDEIFLEEGTCVHPSTIIENGILLCVECGEELTKNIITDKEWRYYGHSDNKHTSDPNRCQARKIDDRNIFKDVELLNINEKVVGLANNLYLEVVKNGDDIKIYRGNSRKAIIFACVYHAYKLLLQPQNCEDLINSFGISKKIGLKGLKYVNKNAPKSSPIRTNYITPETFIDEIMDKFSATREQKKEIVELYGQIINKSSRLNRSRPQSVASGMVYYWICKKNKNISLKEFTGRVQLSELTVNKIVNEINEILEDVKKEV